jgi:hypothetical protein
MARENYVGTFDIIGSYAVIYERACKDRDVTASVQWRDLRSETEIPPDVRALADPIYGNGSARLISAFDTVCTIAEKSNPEFRAHKICRFLRSFGGFAFGTGELIAGE